MKGKYFNLGKLGTGITVILLIIMVTTSLSQAKRKLRRVNMLNEADDSQLKWLTYNPFVRSGNSRRNRTAGNNTAEPASADLTRRSLITDDTDSTPHGPPMRGVMRGVRPPIRIPYRPPLRSPYRPPWP